MTWGNVLTLLHIAHMANEYGGLAKLRDAAVAQLQAVDVDTLGFDPPAQAEEEE